VHTNYFTSNFPLEMPADEVIARQQAYLEATRFYGDAWPRWWPNFGPGILAGFLGARVRSVPGTVWFEPAGQTSIEDLHPTHDADNIWWQRVVDLTQTLVTTRWPRHSPSDINLPLTKTAGRLSRTAAISIPGTILSHEVRQTSPSKP